MIAVKELLGNPSPVAFLHTIETLNGESRKEVTFTTDKPFPEEFYRLYRREPLYLKYPPSAADDAVLKDAERWRVMRHYISPRMASQIFMMSECPKPLDGWSTETWTDAVADAALAQRTAATEGRS